MGKKFMMKVQVLHCIACHSKTNPLIKLKDDIRMCNNCLDKIRNNQTIATPDNKHKFYIENGTIKISEIKEENGVKNN